MDDEAKPPPSSHLPASTATDATVTVARGTYSPAMSFLDLPPEIRNEIYNWLFPTGRSAAQLLARRCGGFIQMSDRFTLLATCRQIYEEASSLLRVQQRVAVKQPSTLSDLMEENMDDIEVKILRYILPTFVIDINYDLDYCIVRNEKASVLHTNWDLRLRDEG